jgi:hypothetical protein
MFEEREVWRGGLPCIFCPGLRFAWKIGIHSSDNWSSGICIALHSLPVLGLALLF